MEAKSVTAAGCMTAPRYECVVARSQIERAFNTAGIPLNISQGVFYGQCMQSMMERLIGKVDYIVTVDFDTMCLAKHITRLISVIVQENEIDALAAMQPMRGKGRLLASRQTENEVVWDGHPIKVDTAHFGLTVIDAKKLAELPKPWFWSTPDNNGEWSDDKTDDDVSFWRQWEKAGNSVYVDPGCRIGHLEELVTVYGDDMAPRHFYPTRWSEIAEETCE